MVIVLREPHVYSRSTLEEMFGPAAMMEGPPDDDARVSYQLESRVERSLQGTVAVRWWVGKDDPENMGEPDGPNELRVEEIQLHRNLWNDEIPPADADSPVLNADDVGVGADVDEAMDTGVWLGELVWNILRPELTLERARELLGSTSGDRRGGPCASLRARSDPRLGHVQLRLNGDEVFEVRIDLVDHAPLVVAIDAISDRLNAAPISEPGEITFAFESTRSHGAVALILVDGRPADGPIAAVNVVEISRGG